jgi:hypothetical protein
MRRNHGPAGDVDEAPAAFHPNGGEALLEITGGLEGWLEGELAGAVDEADAAGWVASAGA